MQKDASWFDGTRFVFILANASILLLLERLHKDRQASKETRIMLMIMCENLPSLFLTTRRCNCNKIQKCNAKCECYNRHTSATAQRMRWIRLHGQTTAAEQKYEKETETNTLSLTHKKSHKHILYAEGKRKAPHSEPDNCIVRCFVMVLRWPKCPSFYAMVEIHYFPNCDEGPTAGLPARG